MYVTAIDHIVLTVASIERSVAFYQRVLGMEHVTFGPDNRSALRFGDQKINLHEAGREFEPRAIRPWPGSGDVCFLVDDLEDVAAHLQSCGIEIVAGPGPRTGARGTIHSVYIRDPDGNLVELSAYV